MIQPCTCEACEEREIAELDVIDDLNVRIETLDEQSIELYALLDLKDERIRMLEEARRQGPTPQYQGYDFSVTDGGASFQYPYQFPVTSMASGYVA